MFSMLPTLAPTHIKTHCYTPNVPSPLSSSPLRSSPLSPRDINVPNSPSPRATFNPMMSPSPTPISKTTTRPSPNSATSTSSTSSSSSTKSRASAYSKRPTKSNPLLHGKNPGNGRETRRKLFLKKVREDQEDKRWQARGGDDEIMRTIWVAEQRRREERIKREALGLHGMVEEEEEVLSLEEVIVDEVAMKEEEELEALLGSMNDVQSFPKRQPISPAEAMDTSHWGRDGAGNMGNQVSTRLATQGQPTPDTPYGSDDEEYDHIFMDVIQEESRTASQQEPSGFAEADHEMMDMS